MNIVLECRWRIGESERYNYVFKVSIIYIEYCLLLVTFLDLDTVVGILHIDLRKEDTPTNSI